MRKAEIKRVYSVFQDADRQATSVVSEKRDSLKQAFKGAERSGKADVLGIDKASTTGVALRLAMTKSGYTYKKYVAECRRLGIGARSHQKINSFFTSRADKYSVYQRADRLGLNVNVNVDDRGVNAVIHVSIA